MARRRSVDVWPAKSDDTAQSLIALRQQVEMARKLQASNLEHATRRLTETEAMLIETLEGVRRFSRDLRPICLEDLGFIPALEMLAREANWRENSAHFTSTATALWRISLQYRLSGHNWRAVSNCFAQGGGVQ